ncbi:hypothetical protein ACKWTF_016590 [Chironomus riparius]
MLKRRLQSKDSGIKSKIQKITSFDQDQGNNINLPYFPIEIIAEIISNLTDINDIKSCMELSRDINNYIFKTPKIMTKLEFNLNCILKSEKSESLKFLKLKGNLIKNMKINFTSESSEILRTCLSQTPNLVEFLFDNAPPECACCRVCSFSTEDQDKLEFNEYWTLNINSIELPKLKVLEIEVVDLYNFLKVTKQVKTLEKLTIFIHSSKHQKIMTDFILQQRNLKVLNLIVTGIDGEINFLSQDISKKVNFKLQSLKTYTRNKTLISGFFDEFLMTQVESLEEIDFDFSPNNSTLDILFNKAKKLRKLMSITNNN